MSGPSTEDKIAQLVHSVLEAVDRRMAEVRREVQVVAEGIERRHAELQVQLNEVSNRVQQLAAGGATDERIARLQAAVDELRVGIAVSAPTASTPAPAATTTPAPAPVAPVAAAAPSPAPVVPPLSPRLPSFTQVSAPLLPTTAPAEPAAALAPIVPAELPVTELPLLPEGEQIDIDQLTDLLTARLGRLNLPRAD